LQQSIDDYLAFSHGIETILIGVGSLGRALLSYFMTGRSNIRIVAAFDTDPRKAGRIIGGCRVYLPEELPQQTAGGNIHCALLAVPGSEAQKTADLLVKARIPSILNFAPIRLKVPPTVFVEDLDVTSSIEKAAFFGRHMSKEQETKK
jgi:redox-sensing transcriptional repressor